MKLLNRASLTELFKEGKRPSEEDFKALIDSTLNKIDDGIDKDFKHGLELSPLESEGKVISLYKNIEDKDASWNFKVLDDVNRNENTLQISSKENKGIKILDSGFVGVNKTPEYHLDVEGAIASKQRVGTFKRGNVLPNGMWHTILDNLEGCQMFEVTACAKGQKNKGKYAFLYALAINAYSGSGGCIRHFQNYYKWWCFWKRIRLRWIGTPFNYKLQIKTVTDYGTNGTLEYQITKLHGG